MDSWSHSSSAAPKEASMCHASLPPPAPPTVHWQPHQEQTFPRFSEWPCSPSSHQPEHNFQLVLHTLNYSFTRAPI